MQFHKLIIEKACLLELGTRTKDGVLRHLLGALEKAGRLTEVDQALTDIEVRERKGATACQIRTGLMSMALDLNLTNSSPVS